MTIAKGQRWGEPDDGDTVERVSNDRELARLALRRHEDGCLLRASVTSGDLLRTLGLDEPRQSGAWRFPVDLGIAYLDDRRPIPFVSHVIAAAPPILGEAATVVNTPTVGSLRLGPRAHVNDGLLDVTTGWLSFGQWREALRRARSGTHVPHPSLRTSRMSEGLFAFRWPVPIVIDRRPQRPSRSLRVELLPDAFFLIA